MKKTRPRTAAAPRGAAATATLVPAPPPVTEGAGLPVTLIRELAQLLSTHGLAELEFERGSDRIRLRRFAAPGAAPPPAVAVVAAPNAPPAAPVPPAAPADDPTVTYITSPFVGTFYRAPSPEAPPYVEVGARIRKGQVLCIVEAMKLMNEIEAELDGVVLEVLVANGHPVEYGERLFKIKLGG